MGGSRSGGSVTSAHALRGGTSSAVHSLTIRLVDGGSETVVLRRYVRPDINDEEPEIAAREADVLHFVERLDVPTPQLLTHDPSGADAGVPAVLMSQIPGRVNWSPPDIDRWLYGLADLLPRIHGTPLPGPGVIRPFSPEVPISYDPPARAR